MMMPLNSVLLAGLMLLLLWRPLPAQRATCDLRTPPDAVANVIGSGTPNEVTYVGGGVSVRCDDGTRIRSDSVVYLRLPDVYEFIGRVDYSDSTTAMTAQYMQYLGTQRRVYASGDVVATDRRDGSTIGAEVLNYFMRTATQLQDSIAARGGPAGERPVATLLRTSARDSTQRDTTLVVANNLDIVAQQRFIARGNVDITRGGVKARASNAEYLEETGQLRLLGNARVEGDLPTMTGDTIVAEGDDGGEFREVRAIGNGHIDAEEMNVEAPIVAVFLAGGEVERVVAMNLPDADPTSFVRARASSTGVRTEADSIDIRAPGRRVDRVIAVGTAFAERIPEEGVAPETPEVIRTDWVRGDTINARFGEPSPEAADTVDRVLEELDVRGGREQARSLYRVPDPDDPDAEPAISYILAMRILVTLKDGEVVSVEADDPNATLHGLYLRPVSARGGGGGDTR